MIIFIRGIPASTDRKDLCNFISDGLQRRWPLSLFRKVTVDQCSILRIENMENQQEEYHGLVHMDDERTAQVMIKRLNGRQLGDSEVEVRRYRQRSKQRERRRFGGAEQLAIVDRRCRERRRQNLFIENV